MTISGSVEFVPLAWRVGLTCFSQQNDPPEDSMFSPTGLPLVQRKLIIPYQSSGL